MDWREFVRELSTQQADARLRLAAGASAEALAMLRSAHDRPLPAELEALLSGTNGVGEELFVGGAWQRDIPLVLSVDEIIRHNAEQGWPERLLFAYAGCDGISFRIGDDGRIWAHHPIEDRYEELASSLREFLAGWWTGEIST